VSVHSNNSNGNILALLLLPSTERLTSETSPSSLADNIFLEISRKAAVAEWGFGFFLSRAESYDK
jgi:hypothetical protein